MSRAALNWQCPICFEYALDVDEASGVVSSIVPCIISSCNSATHPICLDCCWKMRHAEHAFKCPLCQIPATLILPIHCMVSSKNAEAQKKIAQAEDDLRPQKEIDNANIVVQRKTGEVARKIARGTIFVLMTIGSFCLCALLLYLSFQTLLAFMKTLAEFCFNPWGLLVITILVKLFRGGGGRNYSEEIELKREELDERRRTAAQAK